MIIEKLQDDANLTNAEKVLAHYILAHPDSIASMTIRSLAEAAYVSTPTVSRLCQKVGMDSFGHFKAQFSSECTEVYQKMIHVDNNYPFTKEDTPADIADKLAKLSVYHIMTAKENLDYRVLMNAARALSTKRIVDIYGLGLSQTVAYGFAEKMSRIGIFTTILQNPSQQNYRAKISAKDHFAIVISHSGQTRTTRANLEVLHQRRVPTLLFTANRISPMISYATYVCYIYSTESLTMQEKLDSFGSQVTLHFLLDCLYAFVFSSQYEKHMEISQEITKDQFNF